VNIERLRATNLRCFEHVDFEPGPGVNWLTGPNGVGKTTLLEAAYLLSHGRSFRAGGRSAPRRQGATDFVIHAEIARAGKAKTRLGLARVEDHWLARRDGVDLPNLVPLFEACPVVYFGPESQALILGPAEERRGFLDWAVFHMEHASLDVWKAWRRALRQRNALLRQNAADAEFEPWEYDLGELATRIHAMRERCLASLRSYLVDESMVLVPELGAPQVGYRPGWRVQDGLMGQLAMERQRDRERGFTRHGPHRTDWSLDFAAVAQREHLSRGQAKAVALVCTLALTRWLKDKIGEYPLLCLDDLAAELDVRHAALVLGWLQGESIQSWLTRTDERVAGGANARVFHVEHTRCVPIGCAT
jgi:DNA replication and repair protein RecF